MRILWVGTKPPWPPRDGGRLVAALTIAALRQSGLTIDVVTPDDDTVRRGWLRSTAAGLARGLPATAVRHAPASLVDAIGAALARGVDVVHVEQVQAWEAAAPARRAGVPCVLRMHNVESQVWHAATRRRLLLAPVIGWQARRLARWEAAAIGKAAATIALCEEDALVLGAGALAASVHVVPAPAPPITETSGTPWQGTPACVWLGTAGWASNDTGLAWLYDEVWPSIAAHVPDAHLHVFATQPPPVSRPRVHRHAPPLSSADVFTPGAVLLLPLRNAPGIRMRVLEAWATGTPVVATREACRGLDARDGLNVLLADDAPAFARQVRRLVDAPALRDGLIAGGRQTLGDRHDASAVAATLTAIYRDAISRSASR